MKKPFPRIQEGIVQDQVKVIRLENHHLIVDVSPQNGGRITRLFNKELDREFLWKNDRLTLQRVQPGEAYDPNFYGGIDEVIPGDLPETIRGLNCPDHGELWTLPLDYHIQSQTLELSGQLPVWELHYQKRIHLRPDSPWLDMQVRIENRSNQPRVFLWKLHAAALISPGDQLICPAKTAVPADPQWARNHREAPFDWPTAQGEPVDRIPAPDGTTDFLFLTSLSAGWVRLRSPTRGCEFLIEFDPQVFPYLCYFASYGGFDVHYVAVLEPASAMPLSVTEADRLGQCTRLEPGQHLTTQISMYAGTTADDRSGANCPNIRC